MTNLAKGVERRDKRDGATRQLGDKKAKNSLGVFAGHLFTGNPPSSVLHHPSSDIRHPSFP
ncbi:MAG: hypothetical protein Q4G48_10440, partial [Bacteroidia bacterium]|nr:hypothetical protein [Bacteroidia bacterium]